MAERVIIGLTGPAGCGKSTIAQALVTKFGGTIMPFAGPLKQLALSMGWNGEKDERGRRLLQLLGTDVGRECIDENIWVNKWREAAEAVPGVIIADDVRFDNEAETIRAMGGMVFKVLRAGCDYSFDHSSETPIRTTLINKSVVNWPTEAINAAAAVWALASMTAP